MKLSDLTETVARKNESPTPTNGSSGQTIEDAQQYIWQHRRRGVACPCCDRVCKVYKRTVTGGMARWLIELVKLWRKTGGRWVDITQKPMTDYHRSGDYGKLVYWGLCEPKPNTDRRKTRRSGLWRPTELGVAFVSDQKPIARYCHVYLNKPIAFSGPDVTIQQALGTKFSYADVMRP